MHLFAKISPEDTQLDGMLRQCLSAAPGIERDRHFAYLAVWNIDGGLIGEVVRPNIEVPVFRPSSDPSTWYLERTLTNTGNGQEILDYNAPILKNSEIVGSTSLGFFLPGYRLRDFGVGMLATLALPVILLGAAFLYLLFKQEMKPVLSLSGQLQQILEKDAHVKEFSLENSGSIHEIFAAGLHKKFNEPSQAIYLESAAAKLNWKGLPNLKKQNHEKNSSRR